MQPNNNAQLVQEVENFLRSSGIKPSRLGRDVMRDPRFVTELRAGRIVRKSTAVKLRAYMQEKAVADRPT